MSEMPHGYPVRITVRVEFSDGTVHEHEVDNVAFASGLVYEGGEDGPPIPAVAFTHDGEEVPGNG